MFESKENMKSFVSVAIVLSLSISVFNSISYAQGPEEGGGDGQMCAWPGWPALRGGCEFGGISCFIYFPCDPGDPCPNCGIVKKCTSGDTTCQLESTGTLIATWDSGTEVQMGPDFYRSSATFVDSTIVSPWNAQKPTCYYSKTGRDIISDIWTYLGKRPKIW